MKKIFSLALIFGLGSYISCILLYYFLFDNQEWKKSTLLFWLAVWIPASITYGIVTYYILKKKNS